MTNSSRRNKNGKRSDRPSIGDIQISISGSVNGKLGAGNQIIQVDQSAPRFPSRTGGVDELPSFQPAELIKLRRSISILFNESELRDLCFDLGLDYDDLPGAGKKDKARELVGYYHRRGRIGHLVQACLHRRPGISQGEARGPPAH